jgi:signal transduction histidine kinase
LRGACDQLAHFLVGGLNPSNCRGPTIDRSALDQIFDPLTRGAEQRHDTDDGVVLGLYIVRKVARAHGGEVHVRSDKEETMSAVRLPRHNQARPHRPEQHQPIQENAGDKAPP